MYLKPNFTKKAVYQYWHSINEQKWKSDVDQRKSAKNLLGKGSVNGGLGKGTYAIKEVALNVPNRFESIAFSVPGMLERWGSRTREIAIDSCCT
jgi:hypothetical protein